MPNDAHCLWKFEDAIRSLVASGDIRKRVEFAFGSLISVAPEDLSDGIIREKYREIYERCTENSPRHRAEGRIRATLANMSDEDVEEVSRSLFEIYSQLAQEISSKNTI